MKSCPVCGEQFDREYTFCMDHGVQLEDHAAYSTLADPLVYPSETAQARHLSCPVCDREYPLTFRTCPDHGVALRGQGSNATLEDLPPPSHYIHSRTRTDSAENPGLTDIFEEAVSESPQPSDLAREQARHESPGTDAEIHVSTSEFSRRRMARTVASIVLVVMIVVFAAVVLLSERAATEALHAGANPIDPEPASDFIPTPETVQDDKSQDSIPASPPRTEPSIEQALRPPVVPSNEADRRMETRERTVERREPDRAASGPADSVERPRSATASRESDAQVGVSLLRVRSWRTGSGYRYDLTFSMHERAGRTVDWERISLVANSSNGRSQSQSVPFARRLPGSGLVTFSLNVELAGEQESDWRGRASFTAIGRDDMGRTARATFSTALAP